jgi:hypothetical protein
MVPTRASIQVWFGPHQLIQTTDYQPMKMMYAYIDFPQSPHSPQVLYYRDIPQSKDFVNGFKHIVATVNGFSKHIVDFDENLEELEALIAIVRNHTCYLLVYLSQDG